MPARSAPASTPAISTTSRESSSRSSAPPRRSWRCPPLSARTRCGSSPSSSARSLTPNGRATGGSGTRAFKGLREDKPAREVHRESAKDEEAGMATIKNAAATKPGDPTFDGITLTNPDRVYYPDIDLTKLGVAHYYETVAPFMLPYVVRRPISLVRCPEGIDKEHFFQRHAMKGMSQAIKEVPITGGESKKKYLYIDDEAGLFGLVQIGVLEIHDWGVSLDHINEPDRLVFDLDPDEGLGTCHAEGRRHRGARFPRRSRLQELSQIDRRQGAASRGAACAEAGLGRGEALHQGHRRRSGQPRGPTATRRTRSRRRARARSSSITFAISAAARPSSITRPAPRRGRRSPVRCAGTS